MFWVPNLSSLFTVIGVFGALESTRDFISHAGQSSTHVTAYHSHAKSPLEYSM
jgi:hypothetical protein